MERFEIGISGDVVVGYWHWPEETEIPHPVIVMGHGFGTEWRFGTAETIGDFTRAGFAVVTFDYRHYGESGGRPRQLLSVARQLVDWRKVLAHVRPDTRIDPKRLVVWGSSLGGGHARSIAAEDHGISAVLAQVPHCNALASLNNIDRSSVLRTTGHAFLDALAGLLGKVHTIPIVGGTGDTGAMTFPGWKSEGLRLVPPDSHWVNSLPARSMLSIIRYSPGKKVDRIRCPVCIHYGLKDLGVPPASVEKAAKRIPHVELHPFDGDHFDVYHGSLRDNLVSTQLGFIRRVFSNPAH